MAELTATSINKTNTADALWARDNPPKASVKPFNIQMMQASGGAKDTIANKVSNQLLPLSPKQQGERTAKNPTLTSVENVLAAGRQDPPAGAAAGFTFPPLANVVDGAHGTAANTAVKILESMADGRPGFRPERGLGGVQWFVTEGTPYVGSATSNSVTIPVEIEAPRGTLEFGEAQLTKIFNDELKSARLLVEQQYRAKKGLGLDDSLNRRARDQINYHAERMAERSMWTRVGEQVGHSESGVGRVTLHNSQFSRSGNGTFMLTSRPEAVRVRGGANTLVDIIQRTGEPVEKPLLDAAEKLATRNRWTGRVQGAFRVGGRVLIVVGALADGYRIYKADDHIREGVKVAGGWAGAAAAGSAFASWASPSLATGPWGWLAYGVGTLGAGAAGYFTGESIAEEVYELAVDGDPIYVGPRD